MPIKTTNLNPHYVVDIWRDEDPTDPLDMECHGVIHHAYCERGMLNSRRAPKEMAKLAYALARGELADFFFDEGGHLPIGFIPETEEADWFDLGGVEPPTTLGGYAVHPGAVHPIKEVQHNTNLLKRFGVPDTPENIYREDMPPELVAALTRYLLSEVLFTKELTSHGNAYGSHFVWAEKRDIVEQWGVDPDNAHASFEDWCKEFQCYIDGDVWGFTIDYIECDDPQDPLAPRYEEPGLESCGGFIGDDSSNVVSRMADHWFDLDEADADAVRREIGSYMRSTTLYIPIIG